MIPAPTAQQPLPTVYRAVGLAEIVASMAALPDVERLKILQSRMPRWLDLQPAHP